MSELVDLTIDTIKSNDFPELGLGIDKIYPHYRGYSISNIPSSICKWLGVAQLGKDTLAPELHNQFIQQFDHVIFLLIDGMGLNFFQNFQNNDPEQYPGIASWKRILPEGTLATLTSVVPSTTSSALTTLWTGRTPAEHGIIGFELWLKEYSLVANMIHHSAASFNGDNGGLNRTGFYAQSFLPVSTLGSYLKRHDIRSFAFQPSAITHSGLSNMLLQGAHLIPYRTQTDLWVSLENHMHAHKSSPTLNYVYCSELDTLGHLYGPSNERLKLEFSNMSILIERFINRMRSIRKSKILFVMTADHGQIDTPKNPEMNLINHPKLMDALTIKPTGENRFTYLYNHPGMLNLVTDYVSNKWKGLFNVIPAEEILKSGLLGPGKIHRTTRERAGDLIVIPNENVYWWWVDKENLMLGRHGGLSPEEMLVPFFTTVL